MRQQCFDKKWVRLKSSKEFKGSVMLGPGRYKHRLELALDQEIKGTSMDTRMSTYQSTGDEYLDSTSFKDKSWEDQSMDSS